MSEPRYDYGETGCLSCGSVIVLAIGTLGLMGWYVVEVLRMVLS
jgi:hypothetical protein